MRKSVKGQKYCYWMSLVGFSLGQFGKEKFRPVRRNFVGGEEGGKQNFLGPTPRHDVILSQLSHIQNSIKNDKVLCKFVLQDFGPLRPLGRGECVRTPRTSPLLPAYGHAVGELKFLFPNIGVFSVPKAQSEAT